jgi:hypothetical protein
MSQNKSRVYEKDIPQASRRAELVTSRTTGNTWSWWGEGGRGQGNMVNYSAPWTEGSARRDGKPGDTKNTY